ncbi:hypothetical protein MNV84_05975 [Leishmania braziliensis]|nr:hypothetical protein MNV84_05975 [Leishmania braziliensis]
MRRRCLLVDTIRLLDFSGMEVVLLRCPQFYAKENLMTVFPEAERRAQFIRAAQASGESSEANYYLLYTFQSADFVRSEDLATLDGDESQDLTGADDEATTGEPSTAPSPVCPRLKTEDDFSELIRISPTSVEWKDRSRERFFSFMAAARARLEKYFGSANESSSCFFMDWPDPATGLPICTERGSTIFSDADAIQQFFSFNSVLIAGPGGGCRMIEHPRFGLNVYPAVGVLVVPRDAEGSLCEVIRSFAT